MSAQAGWYPDPGGGVGLYRYWDGRAWSAATSPNPAAPPPVQPLGAPTQPTTSTPYGSGAGTTAYANLQQLPKRRSGIGWWIGAAALVVVIVIVAVMALRAIGGGSTVGPNLPGGQPSQNPCPEETSATVTPPSRPPDGRVHGGPVSYPALGPPWSAPKSDYRVPFGSDVQHQMVDVEPNYKGDGNSWVASILVAELQAGDGFFTPQQGSQIVVRCILGKFYDDAEVDSDVKVNRATTIDGHEAWLVESQLSFDIEGLETKGELLIVAIVAVGTTAGLYYASIPDTVPELVQPARHSLAALQVDG